MAHTRSGVALVLAVMLAIGTELVTARPQSGGITLRRLHAWKDKEDKSICKHCDRCSDKESSALAVSIVYASCSDSIALSADAVASATAKGCGDNIAAGLAIGMATLSANSITETTYQAFMSAATLSASGAISIDGGAAAADAFAAAIAASDPTLVPRDEMLLALVMAINKLATSGQCAAAKKITTTVYSSLSNAAPDLVPVFQKQMVDTAPAAGTSLCKLTVGAAVGSRFKPVKDGKGCGLVKKPLFSKDIDNKRTTSTMAVSIAMATCPTSDNAAVIAVAAALASTDPRIASTAMAAVSSSGLPLTAVVQQVFTSGDARSLKGLSAALVLMVDDADFDTVCADVLQAMTVMAGKLGCGFLNDFCVGLRGSGVPGVTVFNKLCLKPVSKCPLPPPM